MNKFQSLMFVDDDRLTNMFHKIVVKKTTITEQYTFFDSPVKALAHIKELNNTEEEIMPDIIFLDINMPEMTGWEFLDKYATLGIKHSQVVMLTTSLLPSDLQKAKDHKLVHSFLNKPLDKDKLKKLADELFGD